MKINHLLLSFFFLFSSSLAYSQTYSIGETIQIDGEMELTIEEAGETTSYNEFFGPDPGNIYYSVLVFIKNISNESITYYKIILTLKDSKGFVYTQAPFGRKPKLPGNDILTGDVIRGYITFEIPEDTEGHKLYYDHSYWGSDDIIIVNLSDSN